eukprot:240444-Pelagomonas_calceolata.AAC.3
MSGQKRPARPRPASLSPGEAISLDSLHDTWVKQMCSVLWGKSCYARPAIARCSPGSGSSSSSSSSSRKGASGSPSSGFLMKTEEMSSPGRGTAWEEQVNTYMPVSVQLLIASN